MRRRRAIVVLLVGTIVLALFGAALPSMIEESLPKATQKNTQSSMVYQGKAQAALDVLQTLDVKGRAPKTGYAREQFGSGWGKTNGCSTRDIILYRDLDSPVLDGECSVVGGTLNDLYTGTIIVFNHEAAHAVQIDHVVALSNAWQTGAQQLTVEQRKKLANDPLELLAVDGPANQAKGDGDAATWLPKNKAFRCEYVARQIAIKKKYALWVTPSEKSALLQVLAHCPS